MTGLSLAPPKTLGIAALALGLVLTGAASAAASDDLDQVIAPDQQQGTGQVVVTAGHVDFGPTFGTGAWALQINDDTGATSYWRDPDDVVLKIPDAAMLTVPDDDAFAFLGMPAGSSAYVVPQTEQSGVPWVGWNTQEPQLLEVLERGATLRIHAIEGPGDVVGYVQGGNFGAPQQLWSTHDAFPQDAWIEINTHTHANWVFSAPGTYLVDAEFTGDLVTGETLSARGTLRFAIGDATDPAAAFGATLASTEEPGTDAAPPSPAEAHDAAPADAESPSVVWLAVGGGAVALAVAVVAVAVTSSRARRRLRSERGSGATS